MLTRLLEYVSIWIDGHGRSVARSLPHAMEWASRLGLPLRIVVTTERCAGGPTGRTACLDAPVHGIASALPSGPSLTEAMRSWTAACTDRGIVCEMQLWVSGPGVGVAPLLRPGGLCVLADRQYGRFCGEALPNRDRLLAMPLLICPPTEARVQRLVVLHEHLNPHAAYLETAVHLCQALHTRPFLVSVARTARDAALKRSFAEGVCASMGLAADCEAVFGPDPFGALRQLLDQRQCSHLVVEHAAVTAAQPPLKEDGLAPWRGLGDARCILAVPETPLLNVAPCVYRAGTAVARSRTATIFRGPEDGDRFTGWR